MKNIFVPYELAVLSKQKGYDVDCIAVQVKHGSPSLQQNPVKNSTYESMLPSIVCVPTWQQIIDWFIEKHGIHISYGSNHSGWYWELTKTNGTTIYRDNKDIFADHYKALQVGIYEAFKLI